MEELFYSIIGLLVQVGIAAIIIYALVWYLYKHIVKPDVEKYMEEQRERHKELIDLLSNNENSNTQN